MYAPDMDPSDAKLVKQAKSSAAAKKASEPTAEQKNAAVLLEQANALKAKLEKQLVTLEKQQSDALVLQAASDGASGSYSNLSKIIKDPVAYDAFKEARLERVREERIANTPISTSTSVAVPTSTSATYSSETSSPAPTPAPVPATPATISPAVTAPFVTPPVKTAPIDTVLFNDEDIDPEFISDLIFENIGGHELINIARNDIINGQDVSYQAIKNLRSLQQQYNPNNILGVQSTSDKYFSNFSIKLENKTPIIGNGPFGSHVYLDTTTGNLTVEAINLESDEQIEIEITLSGTIYEADLTGSES